MPSTANGGPSAARQLQVLAMSSSGQLRACRQSYGLLLVGHGSRDPRGQQEFFATAAMLAGLVGAMRLEPGFLEFAQPTIADGFRALVRQGVTQVVVAPALLFSAAHVRHDIPSAVAAVAAEHPGIVVGQCGHLGNHEAILRLSKDRFDEAVRLAEANHERPPATAAETMHVLVGRGSHDDKATAEMRMFVDQRRRLSPVARTSTAFVAMARPDLIETLEELTAANPRRIIVQPHLLFGGVLLDRLAETVNDFRQRRRDIAWVMTGHLGPSPLLAQALFERATAVAPVLKRTY